MFYNVLKLNNQSWKKFKISFLWKKVRPKSVSGFAVKKKAPTHWKKIFLKKNYQLIYVDMVLKTVYGNMLLNKWVWGYLSFSDFKVPEKLFVTINLSIQMRIYRKSRKFRTPFTIQLSHKSSRKVSVRLD